MSTAAIDGMSVPVVLVGPPRDSVGGMSSVMQQMMSLDMGRRYPFQPFYATSAPSRREGLGSKAIRHVRHLCELRRAIRACSAGVAHIHTCSGVSFARSVADVLVARNAGCKTVLHIHGAKFDEFFASRSSLGQRHIAWALALPDRVIALSRAWQRQLQDMAPRATVVVIENATATPQADKAAQTMASRAEASRPGDPCRILFLGRMDTWKGIDDLLDAAQRLNQRSVPFHLTLAGPPGTAGDATTLKEKIASRRLQAAVAYAGSVFGPEKDRLFREADVYVQPSHNEGMPISLLEALSHGLAVVATRVGAVPEVIEHGREGLLVDARDVARLASALETMIQDKCLRESMSAAAAELARGRFSLDRFEADLIGLYDGLCLAEHPHAGAVEVGAVTSLSSPSAV